MDLKENQNPLLPDPTASCIKASAHAPIDDSSFARKTREINFSRKRDLGDAQASPHAAGKDSKRNRHSISQHDRPAPASHSYGLKGSLVGRLSRFREDSMHDKPSDKPPSTFLRVFTSAAANETCTTLDELMEDYHNSSLNEPASQTAATRSSSRATQMAGLTHHANASLSSGVTLGAASAQSRDSSSLHRLSRAVASMNPVSLWQRVATNWRDQKEGGLRPGEEDDDLVERQIRAEQAYAQYKAAGKLAALGSRASSADLKIFAPGYTTQPSDSGIDMTDDLRKTSTDTPSVISSIIQQQPQTQQRISAPPGSKATSARKKFHLRTPSLQDLKRIASDASSHILTAGSPTKPSARSQEAELADGSGDVPVLRSMQSKRELVRQAKLTKKVSNLEVKLEVARRELHGALLLEKAAASSVSSRPGSRNTMIHHHRFTAPLPSLPSESLLLGDDDDDQHNCDNRRVTGVAGLSDIPDLPPPNNHYSTGAGACVPEPIGDLMHALLAEMPQPPPPISVFESWSTDDERPMSARRAFRKRRHSARPPSPVKPTAADAEASAGASPRHKKLRTPRRERERGGGNDRLHDAPPQQQQQPMLSPPRPRSGQMGLAPSSSSAQTQTQTPLSSSVVAAAPAEPHYPPPPPPLPLPVPRGAAAGLETVPEEHHDNHQHQRPSRRPSTRTLKPILRPSPSVPTSLAAAAAAASGSARSRNVLHKHSRSMSPVKSPEPQRVSRAADGDGAATAAEVARRYRSRSVSPPPAPPPHPTASARGTPEGAGRRRLRKAGDRAVRVWPDGVEVPPLPGRRVQQGPFEWPDDVF